MERQPMDQEKFYAVCGVIAAGLFVALMLGGVALK